MFQGEIFSNGRGVELFSTLREDTHKKRVFLVVGPLRFYPPYTNGLVVHAIFLSFFLSYNSLELILTIFFFPYF